MIEIKHRFTGGVICTGKTVRHAVLENLKHLSGAYLSGAYLGDVDLSGADLGGAYLVGADLRDAYLRGAYLVGADLRDAYLRGADLRGADLRGAYLGGARLAWDSHDLIAEILRRAAGDDIAKLKVAGYVLVCRNKCWEDFSTMNDPLKEWALDELAKWVQEGDDAPAVVKARIDKEQ